MIRRIRKREGEKEREEGESDKKDTKEGGREGEAIGRGREG